MAGAYRRLLERIATNPQIVLEARPSLSRWEKGWVLMRSIAGGA
jgi:phytoene synthase